MMWTDQISCRLMPLPPRIKAFTVKHEEFYTVIVSEALSASERLSAWCHEVEHIRRGDFDSERSADLIEVYAHS